MKHIRVIAPARWHGVIGDSQREIAIKKLNSMGYEVSFSSNSWTPNVVHSSSVEERVEDFHEAYLDDQVNIIMAATGGHSSTELLDEIDWNIVRDNPKPLCGYSDITALLNAVYAHTGQVTFHGPNFSTFGMIEGIEYTAQGFQQAMQGKSWEWTPSTEWSDDPWYREQHNRHFIPNKGPTILHNKDATGTLIGGNLTTLCNLFYQSHMPSLKGSAVLIEDDYRQDLLTFASKLSLLLRHPGAEEIQLLLIGRFQHDSKITSTQIEETIALYPRLNNIPVIYDLDFGHTEPTTTLPIGGEIELKNSRLTVKDYQVPHHL